MIDQFLYTRCSFGLTLSGPGHDIAAMSEGISPEDAVRLKDCCKYENPDNILNNRGETTAIYVKQVLDNGDVLFTRSVPRSYTDSMGTRETFLTHGMVVRAGTEDIGVATSDLRLAVVDSGFITSYTDGSEKVLPALGSFDKGASDEFAAVDFALSCGISPQMLVTLANCAIFSLETGQRCFIFYRDCDNEEKTLMLLRAIYAFIPYDMRMKIGYTSLQSGETFTNGVSLYVLPLSSIDTVAATGKFRNSYLNNSYVFDLVNNRVLYGNISPIIAECGAVYDFELANAASPEIIKAFFSSIAPISYTYTKDYYLKLRMAFTSAASGDPEEFKRHFFAQYNSCADIESMTAVLANLVINKNLRSFGFIDESAIARRAFELCGFAPSPEAVDYIRKVGAVLAQLPVLDGVAVTNAFESILSDYMCSYVDTYPIYRANLDELMAFVTFAGNTFQEMKARKNYRLAVNMIDVCNNSQALLAQDGNGYLSASRPREFLNWLTRYYEQYGLHDTDYYGALLLAYEYNSGRFNFKVLFDLLARCGRGAGDEAKVINQCFSFLNWLANRTPYISRKVFNGASYDNYTDFLNALLARFAENGIKKQQMNEIINYATTFFSTYTASLGYATEEQEFIKAATAIASGKAYTPVVPIDPRTGAVPSSGDGKKSKTIVIIITAVAILLVCVIGVTATLLLKDKDKDNHDVASKDGTSVITQARENPLKPGELAGKDVQPGLGIEIESTTAAPATTVTDTIDPYPITEPHSTAPNDRPSEQNDEESTTEAATTHESTTTVTTTVVASATVATSTRASRPGDNGDNPSNAEQNSSGNGRREQS